MRIAQFSKGHELEQYGWLELADEGFVAQGLGVIAPSRIIELEHDGALIWKSDSWRRKALAIASAELEVLTPNSSGYEPVVVGLGEDSDDGEAPVGGINSKLRCSHCGARLLAGDAFCTGCGLMSNGDDVVVPLSKERALMPLQEGQPESPRIPWWQRSAVVERWPLDRRLTTLLVVAVVVVLAIMLSVRFLQAPPRELYTAVVGEWRTVTPGLIVDVREDGTCSWYSSAEDAANATDGTWDIKIMTVDTTPMGGRARDRVPVLSLYGDSSEAIVSWRVDATSGGAVLAVFVGWGDQEQRILVPKYAPEPVWERWTKVP